MGFKFKDLSVHFTNFQMFCESVKHALHPNQREIIKGAFNKQIRALDILKS